MIQKAIDYLIRKSGLAKPDPWLKDVFGVLETWSGAEVTAENSLQSSAVAACVRLLSESVASLPLFVFERTDNDKRKAPNHPLFGLLHDSPNDVQTSWIWRQQLIAHWLLYGNAYAVIDRNESGTVRALWPLHPTAVTVEAKDGALIYQVWNRAERKVYGAESIFHFKAFSLDGITGMSVLGMARQGISLDFSLAQHGASSFKNGARPGLVITTPGTLTGPVKQQFLDTWSGKFAGALQSGKAALLDGGMDLKTIAGTNDDAQFLGSRQFSVQEICRFFRVGSHMVGDPSRLAYASSESEQLAFTMHTLRPILTCLEAELNKALFPSQSSQYFAEFDMNALSRADQKTRFESYETGIRAGFLEVADVRRWENLPPIATAQPAPEVNDAVQ